MVEFSPFLVDGQEFQPLVWLERVDLPDFGCEGRPEEGEPQGAVWGQRSDGKHFWRIGEAALLTSGFCDDLWIGWRDGQLVLVPAGREGYRQAVPGPALDVVLQKVGLTL